MDNVVRLHQALAQGASALEGEARFSLTLAQQIKRHTNVKFKEQRLGQERRAVRRARRHIDECFADGLSLMQPAEHVT